MSISNIAPARAKTRLFQTLRTSSIAMSSALLLSTSSIGALACACGCGIFDIGGVSLAPSNSDTGLSAWFRYSAMDQNTNFEGTSKAPASDNSDKRIQTSFYTFGAQYMINHDWGLMVELPLYGRSFTTVYDDAGDIGKFNLNAVGDLKVMGMYTGFSPDHSTGVTFGLKLPTGLWKSPNYTVGGQVLSGIYDRDTLPGTGSTDLMLGAYQLGSLTSDGKLSYFGQVSAQIPIATQGGYRPGAEYDAAIGLTYDLGSFGPATKVAPVAQLLGSHREHDYKFGMVSPDSGYDRLFVSPGIDLRFDKLKIYADVEIPVYQRVGYGNLANDGTAGQLVAPVLYKVQVGYDF